MEKITVDCEVSKEAYELGKGVVDLVAAVKVALADGWDMSQDLPVILSAALSSLLPAVQGVDKLGDEFKEDPAAFSKAFALAGADLAGVFLKKKEQV